MTDEKPKGFPTIRNGIIFIVSIIPILTLLVGAYRVTYWASYYSYFNIDMKYVSTGISWTFHDIYIISYLWICICASSLCAFRLYATIVLKEKNYLLRAIGRTIILLFFAYVESIFLSMPDGYVKYNSLKEGLLLGVKIFPLICIVSLLFHSVLIYIFFHGNSIIDSFYYESSVDGKKHISRGSILSIGLVIIMFFCASVFFTSTKGYEDAGLKRDFWVTEDNKYIAMPVSDDRYALIEFEEKGDVIFLFTDKRNFHEINDFPCVKKIFSKQTLTDAQIVKTDN